MTSYFDFEQTINIDVVIVPKTRLEIFYTCPIAK